MFSAITVLGSNNSIVFFHILLLKESKIVFSGKVSYLFKRLFNLRPGFCTLFSGAGTVMCDGVKL